MGKRQTSVCTYCGKESCDGIGYKTEDMYGSYGFHVGVKIVCRNHRNVICKNGKPAVYRVVSGHGDSSDYSLESI